MGSDFYESIEELTANLRAKIPHMGVGANTTIRRAIVDKNARIGDNVRLVNQNRVETADGDNYFIRDGIIIIPKGATIRDNTVI